MNVCLSPRQSSIFLLLMVLYRVLAAAVAIQLNIVEVFAHYLL